MSPITDRSKAKEGGFAQVRAALISFEGDVTAATFDKWGGKLVDEEGKPIPPREFLEIQTENVQVLEVVEELSMPVDTWNFRVNCSNFKGSFWIDKFLESADKFKIQIPEGLVGKRVAFRRDTLKATNKDGTPNPKFDSTNYVIVGVKEASKVPVTPAAPKPALGVPPATVEAPAPTPAPAGSATDPMEYAMKLAIGKTEAQFRSAIGLDPNFAGSPLLSLAKAGMVTQALVNEGKLVLVQQGKQQVYQKPG